MSLDNHAAKSLVWKSLCKCSMIDEAYNTILVDNRVPLRIRFLCDVQSSVKI